VEKQISILKPTKSFQNRIKLSGLLIIAFSLVFIWIPKHVGFIGLYVLFVSFQSYKLLVHHRILIISLIVEETVQVKYLDFNKLCVLEGNLTDFIFYKRENAWGRNKTHSLEIRQKNKKLCQYEVDGWTQEDFEQVIKVLVI
jgi:hypothetical protein